MTFGAWLLEQADREDQVGALASDVAEEFGEEIAHYGVASTVALLTTAFVREVVAVLQVAEVEWSNAGGPTATMGDS